jgi:hypothetical protein
VHAPPPSAEQERRHLQQADRHIAEAKVFIARQQEIVERARAKGGSALSDAIATLDVLESSLRAFEEHRRLILGRLKG